MIRIPGKIPITIYPAFWLFATAVGFFLTFSFIGTLIWVGIIFVSVLFHEFGHALTGALFGQKPRIELVALGGMTYQDGEKLPFLKQFLVVFNGPLFGFLLVLGCYFTEGYVTGIGQQILDVVWKANLFWTIINLIPMLPLDGGQLLRIALEKIFAIKGFRYTLLCGVVVGVLLSLTFFLLQQFIIGAVFFLLAFQNYDTYRRTRNLKESDRSDKIKQELEQAEADYKQGKKEEAIKEFERIQQEAKEGMIYVVATQYLANLYRAEGKTKQAYELLLPLKQELDVESLCLLHQLAYDQQNYQLVEQLGAECFEVQPEPEVALRTACACAALKDARPAIGWLQTAFQAGMENLQEIIKQSIFDSIRHDPLFEEFVKSMKLA